MGAGSRTATRVPHGTITAATASGPSKRRSDAVRRSAAGARVTRAYSPSSLTTAFPVRWREPSVFAPRPRAKAAAGLLAERGGRSTRCLGGRPDRTGGGSAGRWDGAVGRRGIRYRAGRRRCGRPARRGWCVPCPGRRLRSDRCRAGACHTVASSVSWSGSVTITKSQCWRLDADGARRPASTIRSRSVSPIGSGRYERTLRRARIASHVSMLQDLQVETTVLIWSCRVAAAPVSTTSCLTRGAPHPRRLRCRPRRRNRVQVCSRELVLGGA